MEKKKDVKKDKRKKVAVVLTVLALLTILIGTFAWSSYTEWVKNHMQSQGFEPGRVTIVEEFDENTPIDVSPTIKKKVNVANTSSADAFVRISFEEMLNKLENGALAKAYKIKDDAKFPVIINASEFLKPENGDVVGVSGYVRTDFTISDGSDVEDLRLFVKGTGKDADAILVNIKKMTKADFPRDFDFNAHGTVYPVIEGDWSGETKVAQKVQGTPVKKPDGKYVVYTQDDVGLASLDVHDGLGYWGYGVGVGAEEEADWAGSPVWVDQNVQAMPPAEDSFNKSAIADSGITYGMTNTSSKPIKIGAIEDDWQYYKGYFYYTKVLKSTETTTSSVMQEVHFPEANADLRYKVASYNLWVGLEAIPAALSALEAPMKGDGGLIDNNIEVPGKTVYGEVNGAGWGLDRDAEEDLFEYYKSIATIIE